MSAYSVWKKRNVFLLLLGAFWLEPVRLLLRPRPLLALPAALIGVLAGAGWAPILEPLGVAGTTAPPTPLAASCHGLGRAAVLCVRADAAVAAGPLAAAGAALEPAAAWPGAWGLSLRLPAAELRAGALNRAGGATPLLRAVLLPEAGLGPAAGSDCCCGSFGCVAVVAAAAGTDCLCWAPALLLVRAFLPAVSVPRRPEAREDWSVWRPEGWLYCITALPSSLTCSLCLSSSLNTSSREADPAAVGLQVMGSSTLL